MLKSLLCLTFAAVSATAAASTQDTDARTAIAQAWQKYRQGVQNEQELIEVQIHQSGQAPLAKTLWRRTQFNDKGEKLSIKFIAPVADAGLGVLVERNTDAGDQIWLRLPSWTSGRKVLGNRETKYFADTAFTFEDSKQLIGEQTSSFDYRYVRHTDQGDIIAATPKSGVVTGYGKREIMLNKDGVPMRIEYFDTDGQLIKTLTFDELVFPAPGRWRANRIVLKQHQQQSQTILKVTKRQFNLGMSELLFSLPYLLEIEHARAD